MHIVIEKTPLLKALTHVQRVVERRQTMPVLANVLFTTAEGCVYLRATDLELEITEQVAAEIIEPGSGTLPAHMLYDITRKLPEGAQVSLHHSPDSAQITLRCGLGRFHLQSLKEDSFPQLTPESQTTDPFVASFSLDPPLFRNLLEKTNFAISGDEGRVALNGLYFHALLPSLPSDGTTEDSAKLRLVATDSHRLALAEMDAPPGSEKMPGIILPRKCVMELQKLLEIQENPLHISVSDRWVRFDFDYIVLMSKLIHGPYPDYESVIPTNNTKVLHIPKNSFAQAVDRVASVSSSDRTRPIKLSLSLNKLTLSVKSADGSSATEEIEANYRDDPLEIGFNFRYLLDILAEIEEETLCVELADAASPTVLRPLRPQRSDSDKSLFYILMPMRA